jgi:hypothetical protein
MSGALDEAPDPSVLFLCSLPLLSSSSLQTEPPVTLLSPAAHPSEEGWWSRYHL